MSPRAEALWQVEKQGRCRCFSRIGTIMRCKCAWFGEPSLLFVLAQNNRLLIVQPIIDFVCLDTLFMYPAGLVRWAIGIVMGVSMGISARVAMSFKSRAQHYVKAQGT